MINHPIFPVRLEGSAIYSGNMLVATVALLHPSHAQTLVVMLNTHADLLNTVSESELRFSDIACGHVAGASAVNRAKGGEEACRTVLQSLKTQLPA